jgi:hypothetical protein
LHSWCMCWQGSSISNLQGQWQKLGEKLQNESWENRQYNYLNFWIASQGRWSCAQSHCKFHYTHFSSKFFDAGSARELLKEEDKLSVHLLTKRLWFVALCCCCTLHVTLTHSIQHEEFCIIFAPCLLLSYFTLWILMVFLLCHKTQDVSKKDFEGSEEDIIVNTWFSKKPWLCINWCSSWKFCDLLYNTKLWLLISPLYSPSQCCWDCPLIQCKSFDSKPMSKQCEFWQLFSKPESPWQAHFDSVQQFILTQENQKQDMYWKFLLQMYFRILLPPKETVETRFWQIL